MRANVRRAAGKTRIASRLRDAEVAAGGEPPRIHSIDDYFVTARAPMCLLVCVSYAHAGSVCGVA